MSSKVLDFPAPAPTSSPASRGRGVDARNVRGFKRRTPAAEKNASVANPRLPFECIALLLQGGGALGAYQGGVYEALAEAEIHPDWIAGISIGAINGALIAGNAPEARVEKLRAFWERITAKPYFDWSERLFLGAGDAVRQTLNQLSANLALVGGARGFSRCDFLRRRSIRLVRMRPPAPTTPTASRRHSNSLSISIASTTAPCA